MSILLKDMVRIDKSKISGAGKGVFAKVLIRKGKRIGQYKGCLIDKEAYDRLQDQRYIFEVTKRFDGRYYLFYVNAKDLRYSNELRYVNGARGKRQQKLINVEAYQYAEKIYYRACRDIEPGEELVVDYGDNYW